MVEQPREPRAGQPRVLEGQRLSVRESHPPNAIHRCAGCDAELVGDGVGRGELVQRADPRARRQAVAMDHLREPREIPQVIGELRSGYDGAPPADAALDEASLRERGQRGTGREPADADPSGEIALGGKPVADRQPAGLDERDHARLDLGVGGNVGRAIEGPLLGKQRTQAIRQPRLGHHGQACRPDRIPAIATSSANSRPSAPSSGCQSTPTANLFAGSSSASTEPSSAHAVTHRPSPTEAIPW